MSAACGELPGEGAEYEPSDSMAYEFGSIRDVLTIPGEWTGCEHCIAAARREREAA